jgi:hypothetical protein
VPRALVWDGEGAIRRWRSGRIELTGECQAFRGTLAAKVIVCRRITRSQGACTSNPTLVALKFTAAS